MPALGGRSIIGFVLFNVVAVGGAAGLGVHQLRLGRGVALVYAEDLRVWLHLSSGCADAAARPRVDQLMGSLAWKWLLPASLAEPVRDGGRDPHVLER